MEVSVGCRRALTRLARAGNSGSSVMADRRTHGTVRGCCLSLEAIRTQAHTLVTVVRDPGTQHTEQGWRRLQCAWAAWDGRHDSKLWCFHLLHIANKWRKCALCCTVEEGQACRVAVSCTLEMGQVGHLQHRHRVECAGQGHAGCV